MNCKYGHDCPFMHAVIYHGIYHNYKECVHCERCESTKINWEHLKYYHQNIDVTNNGCLFVERSTLQKCAYPTKKYSRYCDLHCKFVLEFDHYKKDEQKFIEYKKSYANKMKPYSYKKCRYGTRCYNTNCKFVHNNDNFLVRNKFKRRNIKKSMKPFIQQNIEYENDLYAQSVQEFLDEFK